MKTDRGAIVGQDLFGSFVYEADLLPTPRTRIQRALAKYHYRRSIDRKTSCKTCSTMTRNCGRYYKCRLVGLGGSPATDIRARNVCDAWRPTDAIPGERP
jgi:hypothetical protein